VHEQLLARRTILIDRALDAETATLVAAQLMSLDAESSDPVTLVVNSPGGAVHTAAAVLDTLGLVRGAVDTTCIGQAVGTAAVVVAAGTGRRRIGGGARMCLRFDDVELSGSATHVGDDLAQMREVQRSLVERLAAITGQERQLIERDVDAGRSLTAPEAVAYGLVDEVIEPGR
jgi:ATP-dependent Clp protease, protease subunit